MLIIAIRNIKNDVKNVNNWYKEGKEYCVM